MTPFFIELVVTVCLLNNPGNCRFLDPIDLSSEPQCHQIGRLLLTREVQSPEGYKVAGYVCVSAKWEDI